MHLFEEGLTRVRFPDNRETDLNVLCRLGLLLRPRLEGVKAGEGILRLGIELNTAFVLINAEMGASLDKDLKAIPEVKEFYSVYGVYDYVVRIEANSMEQLKDVITSKIRRMENVRSTLTMMVID
jgi:DNA-binding Lrp family transcriptional regulator